jgi:histidine triad (HIT) family protein
VKHNPGTDENEPAECVFCEITQRRAPAHIIYEDHLTLAFLDIAPAARGHTLVVPKRHARDLFVTEVEDLSAVMRTAQIVARRVEQKLNAEGVTLFQSNRAAGWQDVFHFHVHVVPRWANDALMRPWRSSPVQSEELTEIAEHLRDKYE